MTIMNSQLYAAINSLQSKGPSNTKTSRGNGKKRRSDGGSRKVQIEAKEQPSELLLAVFDRLWMVTTMFGKELAVQSINEYSDDGKGNGLRDPSKGLQAFNHKKAWKMGLNMSNGKLPKTTSRIMAIYGMMQRGLKEKYEVDLQVHSNGAVTVEGMSPPDFVAKVKADMPAQAQAQAPVASFGAFEAPAQAETPLAFEAEPAPAPALVEAPANVGGIDEEVLAAAEAAIARGNLTAGQKRLIKAILNS